MGAITIQSAVNLALAEWHKFADLAEMNAMFVFWEDKDQRDFISLVMDMMDEDLRLDMISDISKEIDFRPSNGAILSELNEKLSTYILNDGAQVRSAVLDARRAA